MGIFKSRVGEDPTHTSKAVSHSKKRNKTLLGLSLVVLLGATACAPNKTVQEDDVIDLGSLLDNSNGIIGGIVVPQSTLEAASTVGIYNNLFGQVFCTGTIVANNLILTAAHCTVEDPTLLSIYFGSELKKDRELAKPFLRPVLAGKAHDQWAKNTFETQKNWGDMALLRFDGALPEGFKPVRILKNRNWLQKGDMLTLVGYGLIDKVNEKRATQLNQASTALEDANFSDMEILMNQQFGTGACRGDSGGPAYIQVGQELLLVGVTSRGYDDPMDTCAKYSVYSSPSAQLEWVKRAAQELQLEGAIGAKMPQPGSEMEMASL